MSVFSSPVDSSTDQYPEPRGPLRSVWHESVHAALNKGAPFLAYGSLLRSFFGCRVQKISLNTDRGCPHRTQGSSGCAWCRPDSFLPSYCSSGMSVPDQLLAGIQFFSRKDSGGRYLAFLQGYTSTYGPPEEFIDLCNTLLDTRHVAGMVISSRPDTLSAKILDYLEKKAEHHFICVELGIESCNDGTLEAMNRGHDFATARNAVQEVHQRGIFTGAHMIMGLPGDTREAQLGFARQLSALPLDFLKLHHLQILEGTPLAREFMVRSTELGSGLYDPESYLDFCTAFLEQLRPDLVVERFTNEAPVGQVMAPSWNGIKNQEFAQRLYNSMKLRGTWQGRLYGIT